MLLILHFPWTKRFVWAYSYVLRATAMADAIYLLHYFGAKMIILVLYRWFESNEEKRRCEHDESKFQPRCYIFSNQLLFRILALLICTTSHHVANFITSSNVIPISIATSLEAIEGEKNLWARDIKGHFCNAQWISILLIIKGWHRHQFNCARNVWFDWVWTRSFPITQ